MAVPPYDCQITDCLKSLAMQTEENKEVIVSEQEVEKFININKLLNKGIKKSKGEIVFTCDADFLFPDKTVLKRMRNKLKEDKLDAIFPYYYTPVHNAYKVSDGGAFTTRKVIEEYGKLDETLLGVSWVRFPFLKWCMENTNYYFGKEFTIELNYKPFQKKRGKRNWETSGKMRPLYKQTVEKLQGMGAWPV
jgi:glycosyltransferase involved in cell wall biosynthesis